MNIQETHEALSILFRAGESALLVSPPGIGKTDVMHQVTEDIGFDLTIRHPVTDDPMDYKGLGFAEKGEAKFLPYGDLKALMKVKRPTVCFFDDFGQAAPTVQAAVMQVWLGRQINGIHIDDKVVFAAATNRKGDRAAVTGMLEPMKSRITCIINMVADPLLWARWARANDVPEMLAVFIEKVNPGLLSKFEPTAEIAQQPSPRTLAAAGRILALDPPKSLRREMLAGAAGAGFASEFCGFLEEAESWPDLDELMADPSRLSFSSMKIGAQWLFAGMLGTRATRVNLKNLLPVIQRMPIEFQTIAMETAKRQDPDIVKSAAYGQWHIGGSR